MKTLQRAAVVLIALGFILGSAAPTRAATSVGLGTADSFAVLAGSGITNTGATTINGDVGSYPTTSQTGFGTVTLSGTNHMGDGVTQGAKTDTTTAYNNAAGAGSASPIVADLGGQTLTPGVYNSGSSIGLTGALTLDGQGDADAVFIFQAGSTLTTASSSSVILTNGAQPCNVFWQVGSSATLGTTSTFSGTILAADSITDDGGSTINGRFLARGAAVTLNNTTITKPPCSGAVSASSGGSSSGSGGGNGGSGQLPLINVTKIPNPLALPEGSGSVTYTYKVTNIGDLSMSQVTLKDNKCAPVKFLSGDRNGDSKLDLDEIWTYRCTTTLTKSTKNTATAHGFADGYHVYDTATATVLVGTATTPPLIHLIKVPSVFVLPASGGPVTYTYTVTNPGTAPLSNVTVTDDKCTGLPSHVIGDPGDANKNNLLDHTETWSFTCQTNLTGTTTNIGTAKGEANGLTAIDTSFTTVVVGSPKLPNTGNEPSPVSWGAWGIHMPLGLFANLLSF